MRKDREVDLLAAAQWGVVGRAQALGAGLSPRAVDRRLASGAWIRVLPSVYRLASAPASWHQSLTAAWLWAGEGATVSHRAAAALLGLDGVETRLVELSVPRPRRSPGFVLLHTTAPIPRSDLQRWGPLIVTNATRTLIDLGSVVGEEIVEAALDHAIRRGMTSIARLRRRLDAVGRSGRRGPAVIHRLLQVREGRSRPSESVLETRLLKLLRAAGWPEPVPQYEVRTGGKTLARIDLAYPDRKLAVECDGYRFHSGRRAWQRDLWRRNLLAEAGWRVLHVTWDDLEGRPAEVLNKIRSALD